MLNLDPAKLLVIAVVAIILLGPDKLPQVARQVGGAWRSFNEFRHRMETEVRSSMPDLPSTTEIARLARSPSALLDHLSNMGTDEVDDEDPPGPGAGRRRDDGACRHRRGRCAAFAERVDTPRGRGRRGGADGGHDIADGRARLSCQAHGSVFTFTFTFRRPRRPMSHRIRGHRT